MNPATTAAKDAIRKPISTASISRLSPALLVILTAFGMWAVAALGAAWVLLH